MKLWWSSHISLTRAALLLLPQYRELSLLWHDTDTRQIDLAIQKLFSLGGMGNDCCEHTVHNKSSECVYRANRNISVVLTAFRVVLQHQFSKQIPSRPMSYFISFQAAPWHWPQHQQPCDSDTHSPNDVVLNHGCFYFLLSDTLGLELFSLNYFLINIFLPKLKNASAADVNK